MASCIPACKATVLTVLTARAGLAGVRLAWAGPTRDEDFVGEMVFLGAVQRTSVWGELGSGRRVEDFTVDVTVYVEQSGDDPQTVETRAYALWDEVEDALRDDIRAQPSSLRTAGVFQFNGMTSRGTTGPATTGMWGARLDGSATFQARNV